MAPPIQGPPIRTVDEAAYEDNVAEDRVKCFLGFKPMPPYEISDTLEQKWKDGSVIFDAKVRFHGMERDQHRLAGFRDNTDAAEFYKSVDHAAWTIENLMWGDNKRFEASVLVSDDCDPFDPANQQLGKIWVHMDKDALDDEDRKSGEGRDESLQCPIASVSEPSSASASSSTRWNRPRTSTPRRTCSAPRTALLLAAGC